MAHVLWGHIVASNPSLGSWLAGYSGRSTLYATGFLAFVLQGTNQIVAIGWTSAALLE